LRNLKPFCRLHWRDSPSAALLAMKFPHGAVKRLSVSVPSPLFMPCDVLSLPPLPSQPLLFLLVFPSPSAVIGGLRAEQHGPYRQDYRPGGRRHSGAQVPNGHNCRLLRPRSGIVCGFSEPDITLVVSGGSPAGGVLQPSPCKSLLRPATFFLLSCTAV
jgi:hypothetical protein